MLELTINGERHSYSQGDFPEKLTDLLKQLNLADLSVVAEIDGIIINKSNFAATALSSGMKIELVKFVGGG